MVAIDSAVAFDFELTILNLNKGVYRSFSSNKINIYFCCILGEGGGGQFPLKKAKSCFSADLTARKLKTDFVGHDPKSITAELSQSAWEKLLLIFQRH